MLHAMIVGLVLFVAHLVSTVTGFGAAILALPVLTLLVGLVAAKQTMVVLGFLLYTHLTVREWEEVDFRELGRILMLATPGLVVGMLAYEFLPARASMGLLGLYVVTVGVRGLVDSRPVVAAPTWSSRVMLFLGGLVHGAFTTGGPLIVVYCRRALPDRAAFRATLGAMWVMLGFCLIVQWTAAGEWEAGSMRVILLGLPFLVAGMISGQYLHRRIDARTFGAFVHLTLLATGGVLCWSALR